MFHGPGHDGAASVAPEDPLASELLRDSSGERPVRDVTESNELSLWTPAPGAVVVLPERYTPTYAYPALVWLAGPGETESSLRDWLEQVSTRNFVGIGLRLELYSGWTSPREAAASHGHRPGLARYDSVMRSIENWVQLHPRRKYVVGAGVAARTAVAWLLLRPDWFAGAVAIDPPHSTTAARHSVAQAATGRRLLWLRSQDDTAADLDDAELLALGCLGLDLTTRRLPAHRGPELIGRCINQWVLDDVPSTIRD